MWGLNRRGVDPFGVPPLWWAPDGFVPSGQVWVGAGAPVTSMELAAPLIEVTLTTPIPFFWAPFVDVVERRTVLVGALTPTALTARLKSPAASVAMAGKLARLAVQQQPVAAGVAVRGGVPTVALGILGEAASVAVGGAVPDVVASIGVPRSEVGVAVPLSALTVLMINAPVSVGLSAHEGRMGSWQQTPAASVTMGGKLGSIGVAHRAAPALIWVGPRAPWSRGLAHQAAPRLVVLNARTLGVSEYALAWADVVMFEGEVYGLSATGIERLAGPLEATATPLIETGALSLAGGQLFNLPKLSLGAYSLADCEVSITTKEYGNSFTETGFTIAMSAEMDQQELILGTHQQARTYQIKLEFAGETKILTLDGHGLNPVRPRRA